MSLTLWKDQELSRLRRDMESLFEAFCHDFSMSCPMDQFMGPPRVELSETGEELIFQADIPGLDAEGLRLSIEDEHLVIQGRREHRISGEAGESFHSSSFSQRILLPVPVQIDRIRATFKDGRLTVRLPKKKPEPPRKIPISVGAPTPGSSS
jgi:HSP20 family protein